jgi:hypothetical protein
MKKYILQMMGVMMLSAMMLLCTEVSAQIHTNWADISRIKPQNRTQFSNGGWNYDAYPELERLNAHSTITVADIKGPAVITCFHTIQHMIPDNTLNERDKRALAARGIILEIYFNDSHTPSVRVPLADFFADGCGGQGRYFGSLFVEKAPKSYNCFIPMPFEKSAKVLLINETGYDLMNYTFVEYEQLPKWDSSLGYFHAAWKRFTFQLNKTTNLPFFKVDGSGHLIGRAWSVSTDEPFFKDYYFVMEANNEIYIDGEERPRIDYLGSEDSFTFSWGFNEEYTGPYSGMNFISKNKDSHVQLLSIFRFLGNNAIRFNKRLEWKLNWSKEQYYLVQPEFVNRLTEVNSNGGGWVDYATTFYWYQSKPGYQHDPMPPLDERCKMLLKSNPK